MQRIDLKYLQLKYTTKKRGLVKTKPPGVIKNSHYDCELRQNYNSNT